MAASGAPGVAPPAAVVAAGEAGDPEEAGERGDPGEVAVAVVRVDPGGSPDGRVVTDEVGTLPAAMVSARSDVSSPPRIAIAPYTRSPITITDAAMARIGRLGRVASMPETQPTATGGLSRFVP